MSSIEPEVLEKPRSTRPRVSVILIDWGVRQSFHSLRYLDRQTAARPDYELIWLEFHARKPKELVEAWADDLLDQWIVAGYPKELIFHKHRLYNLGILAARGDICVICDSDAMFQPTFIESILQAFDSQPNSVVHLDEVRNNDPSMFPFAFPSFEAVTNGRAINWTGRTTKGLDGSLDMLHDANYGACMAARRDDLLAIGGADEHIDYLGYVCGPYEMTFRLVNHGRPERWLSREFLYHTWHPNESGINVDYKGPHDGRCLSLRALEARGSGRVRPIVENPWTAEAATGPRLGGEELTSRIRQRLEPSWLASRAPAADWQGLVCFERDFEGFNLYWRRGRWCAAPARYGIADALTLRRVHPVIWEDEIPKLRNLCRHYNSLPRSPLKRLLSQPLYRLPGRAYRRAVKELSRWF